MMVPASGKELAFDPVISAFLDPTIKMCEQWAEAYKSKGAIQSSRSRTSSDPNQSRRSSVDAILTLSPQNKETPSKIFLSNCLCAIQKPLLKHEVASEYVKKLGVMIDNQIKGTMEIEVEAILRKCCLSDKMPHFHKYSSNSIVGSPLSEIEETSPAPLSDCLKALFGLVLGSENSLPESEQIQVPGLRSEASTQVAKSLAEVYELIYNAILDPKNIYPDPKSLARHPPDQIRTILSI